ncbi:MAG: hypothetical protein ACOYCA_01655 [Eggerthellaceae bacterium]|jgi:hypothetical protein
MAEEEKSMKELLDEEIDRRVGIIETSEDEEVKRLTKGDYIGMVVLAIFCVIVIAIGVV